MTKERKTIQLDLQVDIEESDVGLWYITSPAIRGLLVAAPTRESALLCVGEAVRHLTAAADAAMKAWVEAQ